MLLLQSLLLAAHLLTMNLASSGPLACVFVLWYGAGKREGLDKLGRQMATWSLIAFLLGAVLGLISGWVMWQAGQHQFFSALQRVPSKISYGIWELGFYVVCMAIYIVWWKWKPPRSTLSRSLHTIVALAAASNLLWHFPALMTALAHLAVEAPEGDVLDAADFRQLIFQAPIMSRWLHVWLASIATTGIVLSWLAQRALPTDDTNSPAIIAWGGRFALGATLLQLPVGMWLLLSSSTTEQNRLMGGDPFATLLLISSITAALALLHQLSAIALDSGTRRNVTLAATLLILTVLMMSTTLLLARGPINQTSTDPPPPRLVIQR